VKNGIEIALIWLDQDVLEFLFTCSNGRFSGQAEIYLSHDGLFGNRRRGSSWKGDRELVRFRDSYRELSLLRCEAVV